MTCHPRAVFMRAILALLAFATAISAGRLGGGFQQRGLEEGDAVLTPVVMSGTIAYVLEPFSGGNQTIDLDGDNNAATERGDGGGWYGSSNNLRLRRACQEEDSEEGLLIEDFHDGGCVAADYNLEQSTSGLVEFGRTLQDDRYHSCLAATHLTLRLAHFTAETEEESIMMGNPQVRITLLVNNGDDFNSEGIGISSSTDNAWSELSVELPLGEPFLGRITGWRINLLLNDGSTPSRGSVYLDRLACVGGSNMMSAAFTGQGDTPTEIYEDLIERGAFTSEFYESELSEKDSTLGVLPFDRNVIDTDTASSIPSAILYDLYVAEQTKSWGGFIGVRFLAPGPAFYDLSEASYISFQYETLRPASPSGRVHLRLILFDSSDCLDGMGCLQTNSITMEAYYSFHHVLDHEAGSGINTIHIDLEGNADSSSPFWRTGWDGQVGNDALDKSTLKGWAFEINVDSQGGLGSSVSGSLMVGNLTANFGEKPVFKELVSESAPIRFIAEPDLLLEMSSSPKSKKVEFVSREVCPEKCLEDTECLYAQSWGRDCYLYSRLGSDEVLLKNTGVQQNDMQAFWMDIIEKRGDFCDLCDCNESLKSIDCSDRELAIVPKSFTKDWSPLSLDLRGNPNIVILGNGTLSSIAESLEELWLPQSLRYLSTENIRDLPMLTKVYFEDIVEDGSPNDNEYSNHTNNVIWDSSGSFLDVCCGLGESIELPGSDESLTFCNMQVHKPGIDTIYEPFVEYIRASQLMELRQSSTFMAEAAESVEYCAEYCSNTMGCNYFSYDARHKEAEHHCYLRTDNGTYADSVCCSPDDYGDRNGTIPGWTSGRPPRTRHIIDNAAVQSGPRQLFANETNEFTVQYSVSLGSAPLRGAVWIEPTLESTQTDVVVKVSPTMVALYDADTTATFEISISGSREKETLLITNLIESCDKAFMSGTAESVALNNIFIEVGGTMEFNYLGSIRIYGYFLVALIFASSLACAIWVQIYKDTTIVSASQPFFLYLLLFGTVVLGSSIIPLTFDDDNPDMEGNDAACVAFPWLVSTGFTLVFSALFSKIWRINKIMTASRTFRRINVTHGDVLAPLLATLSMNFVLLLVWTLVDPPQWTRVDVTEFESYGICSTGEGVASTVIVSLLLALNFLCVVITNIQAYKTRKVSDEFNESNYIVLAMISIMQIFLVGVPLVFLTTNNPTACFFVITSMILVITMSVLMCLFVPKFRRVYKRHSTSATNSGISVFNTSYRNNNCGSRNGSSGPQFNGNGSSGPITAVQFKDSMNEQPMAADLAMESMHVNASASTREVIVTEQF